MKNKYLIALASLFLSLSLISCGGDNDSSGSSDKASNSSSSSQMSEEDLDKALEEYDKHKRDMYIKSKNLTPNEKNAILKNLKDNKPDLSQISKQQKEERFQQLKTEVGIFNVMKEETREKTLKEFANRALQNSTNEEEKINELQPQEEVNVEQQEVVEEVPVEEVPVEEVVEDNNGGFINIE